MDGIQEFFASGDGHHKLIKKLMGAGFERVPSWQRAYRVDGIFVHVQPIDRENHVAQSNPVPWGFVMEMSHPLSEYPADHQVRAFFGKLDGPIAYGLPLTGPPQYPIEAYLPLQ